jgi:UDP-N-acetylmuramyl pentapeptide phosphotransferase/UDP-N-acetylglucosamine-1-phosphate transferase
MYEMMLAFITAFTLTYFLIPSIVKVAHKKRLWDEPDERRAHTVNTPSLGGIAIFAGLIFSIVLWTPFAVFGDLQYILCSFLIIFLIGAKDDIDPVEPKIKIAAQLLAATILVFKSKVQISSLYGLFGIYEISNWVAIPLSIFTIIVIINAFNLIDGINGLAGSIGALTFSIFGIWFYLVHHIELAVVAFATVGAIIAFLRYNATPAQIFMGDTGSLMLGIVASVLSIKFIDFHRVFPKDAPYLVDAVPAVTIGILIIPLFDTLRVFAMRMMKGKSPFRPDKTHIHHLLLAVGFSHMQASGVLVLVNLLFIVLVFSLQSIGNLYLMFITLGLASALSFGLYWRVRKRQQSANKQKQLSA